MRSLWLMYHDVYEPAQARAAEVPLSSAMYHVSADRFRLHLEAIAKSGLSVTTVGRFVSDQCTAKNSMALTFDDGWAGAFAIAVPLLAERGWRATFFVTRDFMRRRGFCEPSMLVEAASAGMEIGVHGTTHRMLSSCSRSQVVEEFRACKQALESLLGQPVEHASLPGGALTPTVVACAEEVGVKSLCNSRPGLNTPATSRFDLRRLAIRDSTSIADMSRYCAFDIDREKARWMLLRMPQAMLGMRRYSRLRRFLLNEADGHPSELFKP